LVLLLIAVIVFTGFTHSVLIPANPMPLTSPTFELRSDTTYLLYVREVVLVFSGTSVTQVQVIVFNNQAAQNQAADVTVQIYDWGGNLIFQGGTTVSVSKRSTATATVNLNPPVPYSSIGRVVASVASVLAPPPV
jgi:hypothetical protein